MVANKEVLDTQNINTYIIRYIDRYIHCTNEAPSKCITCV